MLKYWNHRMARNMDGDTIMTLIKNDHIGFEFKCVEDSEKAFHAFYAISHLLKPEEIAEAEEFLRQTFKEQKKEQVGYITVSKPEPVLTIVEKKTGNVIVTSPIPLPVPPIGATMRVSGKPYKVLECEVDLATTEEKDIIGNIKTKILVEKMFREVRGPFTLDEIEVKLPHELSDDFRHLNKVDPYFLVKGVSNMKAILDKCEFPKGISANIFREAYDRANHAFSGIPYFSVGKTPTLILREAILEVLNTYMEKGFLIAYSD